MRTKTFDDPASLRAAISAGRIGAWHLDIEKNRLTYSGELLALIRLDTSRFGGTLEAGDALTHPDDLERVREERGKALTEGERLEHEYRIIRPDGAVRWMDSRGTIVRRAGAAAEVYGVMIDITERKAEEERQRLLIAERDHRMNNTLARIAAIVERSMSEYSRASAASVAALTDALTGRLNAMARAHTRISRGTQLGAGLKELLEDELAPYRSQTNVTLDGPDLTVAPAAVRTLGMVFHELATNAVKHGALSSPDGRVAVRWQLAGEKNSAQLKLVWAEAGGPAVAALNRHGLGTRLIRNLVRHELGGEVELRLAPAGVHCEIHIAIRNLIENARGRPDLSGEVRMGDGGGGLTASRAAASGSAGAGPS
jgi:two-component sensor histidine kinase